MYSRQNTIRHTAFKGPNPMPASSSANAAMPSAELAFTMPNSTAQLETTTSFAEMPAISATAICQKPSPTGMNTGAMNLPTYAAKLLPMSSTNPPGPKYSSAHIIMVAINIVVPAFTR